MSFMKKMMARVGVGSSEVDTILNRNVLVPGETVDGVIKIRAGSVEQTIEKIDLSLHTTYVQKKDDSKVTKSVQIAQHTVANQFTLQPNDKREFPFAFILPLDAPISKGKSNVWLQTGLDIKNAVDPQDKDMIQVAPHPYINAFLQAVDGLGFKLREVENEEAHGFGRLPFIQEFEFHATHGAFRSRLDELEAVFQPVSKDNIRVILEIDRKARGFSGFLSEMLETDESKVQFMLTTDDVNEIQRQLTDVLNQYA
ncbi:sporulation protein [Bacillus sp. es.036]|uniref:sporulation protein n=1 Tax=Bacillus sp. es.036 TaxID=1761764 RepID=UPI000BF75673|nr:sporulation protein [Bacillus sp. es.036]PFG12397.1 sporulation-control protein [Bacillus sp. es.036]